MTNHDKNDKPSKVKRGMSLVFVLYLVYFHGVGGFSMTGSTCSMKIPLQTLTPRSHPKTLYFPGFGLVFRELMGSNILWEPKRKLRLTMFQDIPEMVTSLMVTSLMVIPFMVAPFMASGCRFQVSLTCEHLKHGQLQTRNEPETMSEL